MTKGTVLIVDDDVDTRMILSARLLKQDYTCVFAADCYQAISSARQHHPLAILLDLHLPAGDGYMVLQRLKSMPALSCIPVVVISSDERTATESRALAAGAVAYLEKPVGDESLRTALQTAFGESI